MTTLLKSQLKIPALKQSIELPLGLFIDGEFRSGRGTQMYVDSVCSGH